MNVVVSRISTRGYATGPTRKFGSRVFYDPAEQVSSLIHTPLAGSSVAESGHHYVYDLAGIIASKQVESPSLGATMTAYSHNELNQITGIGGTAGSRKVTVRGGTSEPSNVQAKPSTSGTWTSARMLEGDRFEADLNLAAGANQLQIKATDGSGNTSNYTYSLALASAPAAAPTHDLDGNRTSDGIRSYEWDNQNRLIKITWDAGSNKTTENRRRLVGGLDRSAATCPVGVRPAAGRSNQFKYNALGQRAERIDKTGSTETAHHYYLYDGIRLLCRYQGGTATNNIDRRYFDQGEQRKNGTNWDGYYYTRDHLGSVREVLASNGTLVARYDYDPYGKRSAQYEAPTYANACDLGYTGHITQPSPVNGQTELVMTLFRAYDPELGRWLSADPIGEVAGANLYVYCFGDPLRFYDPDGRFPWVTGGIGALIGGIGAGIASGGDWRAIVAGAAGGFVTGATFNPAAGSAASAALFGALGGLTSGLVTEGLEAATGDCFNPENVVASTVGGAVVGAIGGRLDMNAEVAKGSILNNVVIAGEKLRSGIAGGSLTSIGNSLGNAGEADFFSLKR